MTNIYDFDAYSIDGKNISFKAYSGKVILIVNTASRCGFTYQYEELQKLYDKFLAKDFIILGFPCNQFMKQEPENERNIMEFCENNYKITFPMFQKIKVNGPDSLPLFKYLKVEARGPFGIRRILWNFTKFLIGRDGHVIKRFQPMADSDKLKNAIKELL